MINKPLQRPIEPCLCGAEDCPECYSQYASALREMREEAELDRYLEDLAFNQ